MSLWQAACDGSVGRYRDRRGQTVKMRAEGQLQFIVTTMSSEVRNARQGCAAVQTNRARALFVPPCAGATAPGVTRVSRRTQITASACAACRAKPAAPRSVQPRLVYAIPEGSDHGRSDRDLHRHRRPARRPVAPRSQHRRRSPIRQGCEIFRRNYLPQGRQEEVTERSCRDFRYRMPAQATREAVVASYPAAVRSVVFRSSKHIYAQVIDDLKVRRWRRLLHWRSRCARAATPAPTSTRPRRRQAAGGTRREERVKEVVFVAAAISITAASGACGAAVKRIEFPRFELNGHTDSGGAAPRQVF